MPIYEQEADLDAVSGADEEEREKRTCPHDTARLTGNYGDDGWECLQCHQLVAVSWPVKAK